MPDNINFLSEINKKFILKPDSKQNNANIPQIKPLENDSVELSTTNKKKKNLAFVAGATAAITAGTILLLTKIRKNSPIDISKINFDKGIASLSDGTKLTGSVQKTYENGDMAIMDYVDGILKQSTITGKNACKKVYEISPSGQRTVKITRDGITTISNVSEMTSDAMAEQQKLFSVLDNVENLSSDKFKEFTDPIKNKSIKQKAEIQKIYDEKAANEAQIKADELNKAEAERLAEKKNQYENEISDIDKIKKEQFKTFGNLDMPDEKTPIELDLANVEAEPAYSLRITATSMIKKYPDGDYSELAKMLDKAKDIPLAEASKLEDYSNKPYNMPLKFMISANETASKEGVAIIADEIPEIFKGIDKQQITDTIDRLGLAVQSDKPAIFEFAGKKFNVDFLGGGAIGNVYKISDEAGNSVAIKFFKDPSLTGLQGAYAEIPILRQANLDGVIDVPKFYMANAAPRWVKGYKPVGGWQMVQCLDKDTPLKEGKLNFLDWLDRHGLAFGDYNSNTKVGNYISDVGGVISKNHSYSPYFIQEGGSFMDSLLSSYHRHETAFDVLNTIKKLNS